MKLFFRGEPKQVDRFLTHLEASYEVITHYKQKDHFDDKLIRVGTTLNTESRQSIVVQITAADEKEISLHLLDGKVIEMDGSTLIMGKTIESAKTQE